MGVKKRKDYVIDASLPIWDVFDICLGGVELLGNMLV